MPVRGDVIQARAGAYRLQVGILVPTDTRGAGGSVDSRAWSLSGWMPCAVTPRMAGEDPRYGGVAVPGEAEVRTRWRQDLRDTYRLLVPRHWTQLAAAVDATETGWTVDSAAMMPLADYGDFLARVDDEIVRVTAGFGTTGWTVVRDEYGTSPAAHAEDATVIELVVHEIDGIVPVEGERRELLIGAIAASGDGRA